MSILDFHHDLPFFDGIDILWEFNLITDSLYSPYMSAVGWPCAEVGFGPTSRGCLPAFFKAKTLAPLPSCRG